MAIQFGRYELLERISLGGMAEVFRAQAAGAAGAGKIVAIKRILPQFCEDERFISMFIDEARISANLSHDNIGRVHDFGQVDGEFFIAMEYIPGRDLAAVQEHLRAARQPMAIPLALKVGLDISAALHYAHSKRDASGQLLRIVHRDVSPPNIVLSYDGSVKLIDFGIAKALSRSSRRTTGLLKGKYGYLSPEQAEGKEVDSRSDVFSLGIVLFELLTGQRLFHAESEMSVILLVRRAEIPSIASLNPSVPGSLEGIVRRALSRAPADRFDAGELNESLNSFVQAEGLVFSNLQLAQWMAETFPPEPGREAARASPGFAEPQLPPGAAQPLEVAGSPPGREPPAGTSGFDDDENVTTTVAPPRLLAGDSETAAALVGPSLATDSTQPPGANTGPVPLLEERPPAAADPGSRREAALAKIPSSPQILGSGKLGGSRLWRAPQPARLLGPRRGGAALLSRGTDPLRRTPSPPGGAVGRAGASDRDSEVDTLRPGRVWATEEGQARWDEAEPPTAPGADLEAAWARAVEEFTDPDGEVSTTGKVAPAGLGFPPGSEGDAEAAVAAGAERTGAEGGLSEPLLPAPAVDSDLDRTIPWDETTTGLSDREQESRSAAEEERTLPEVEASRPEPRVAPRAWEDGPTPLRGPAERTEPLEPLAVPEEVLGPDFPPLPADADQTYPPRPVEPPRPGVNLAAPAYYEDGPTTLDVPSTVALRELSAKDSGSFAALTGEPAPEAADAAPARDRDIESLLRPSAVPPFEPGLPEQRAADPLFREVPTPSLSPVATPAHSYLSASRRGDLARWLLVVLLLATSVAATVSAVVLLVRRTRGGPARWNEPGQPATRPEPSTSAGSRAAPASPADLRPLSATDAGEEGRPRGASGQETDHDGRTAPTGRSGQPRLEEPAGKAEKLPRSARQKARKRSASRGPHTRSLGKTPSARGKGSLAVSSRPWARVFVDGSDTGRNTPITPSSPLQLASGRHRVALYVGERRFEFDVEIREGQTTRLSRDLPVERPGERSP